MQAASIKSAMLPDLSVRIMLSVLDEAGLDPQAALEAADIPDGLPALPGEISAAQELQFQRAFVSLTGYRPDLWLQTGLRYHLPSYGQLGMALMTASTLDEMVKTCVVGRPLDYSLAAIKPIIRGETLKGEVIDISAVPEAMREFTVFRDIGAIATALRDVWKGEFPVKRIQVAVPRPRRGTFRILGAEIVFDAEDNAILWNGDHSRQRLQYGDPVLHAAYVQDVRARVQLHDGRQDLVAVLSAALTRNDGTPLSLTMLAAETGASERTLQRRLMARGVRFRDLLEEARRRVAIDLLTSTNVPIAEIAWRLGYSETTSFNHAFRRWTGGSPAMVRKERQGSAAGNVRGRRYAASAVED